jgi:uncharacterized membrane protein
MSRHLVETWAQRWSAKLGGVVLVASIGRHAPIPPARLFMIRIALCLAVFSACTSDTSTGITAADVTCPSGSTLTYANFGASFLADHCLSCHTSQQRPTLTSQAQVQANASAIVNAAVMSTVMPQGTAVSTAERKLLGEWLACGAP